MPFDSDISQHDLAQQFVRYTDRHIFLTGKAGTGKTSFLHRIRREAHKRMVVLAPTGVAAIHAGGVTIHSFFQIVPSIFLPEAPHEWGREELQVKTPRSILRNVRYAAQKKELMEDLELIIIDEVSMLRADMLDAIDSILRQVRRKQNQPFGGVQMLFIGDLFQLPPVVRPEDWELMKGYYESPFFFDASVLRQSPPLCIELKKIFRQEDPIFISILNAIRNNEADTEALTTINRHYHPNHIEDGIHITLTTHNAKADLINHRALAALPGDLLHFEAEIEGDFPEKNFPAEQRLSLKIGARIMFIRNDKGESRRFFNGKLATVIRIDEDRRVFVQADGESGEMEIEPETWKNIRYRYDRLKESVEEEEMGSFRQLPIRLAWAITIHKSQGLTFERAVIDAGESFSPGQVYVALSRLTGLSGLILKSRIHAGSIQTDARVQAFTKLESTTQDLITLLAEEKEWFIQKTILKAFDFQYILRTFSGLQFQQVDIFPNSDDEGPVWLQEAVQSFRDIQSTSQKFSLKLQELLESDRAFNYVHLVERCASAMEYFKSQLGIWKERLTSEIFHLRLKGSQKKAIPHLRSLESKLEKKERLMEQTMELAKGMAEGLALDRLIGLLEPVTDEPVVQTMVEEPSIVSKTAKKDKPPKERSAQISLELFLAGHTIHTIAEMRSITLGTVFSHLIPHLVTGEVKLSSLVELEKVERILEVASKFAEPRYKPIKDLLGEDYTYDEIRAVLSVGRGDRTPKSD